LVGWQRSSRSGVGIGARARDRGIEALATHRKNRSSQAIVIRRIPVSRRGAPKAPIIDSPDGRMHQRDRTRGGRGISAELASRKLIDFHQGMTPF
jgi:hypothetical protein